MSRCPSAQELVRFVDGGVSVEDAQRIEAHITRCVACREQVSSLRALIEDLQAGVPGELDVAAHKRAILDRLDRSVQDRPRRPWVAWLGAAAAAFAAGGLFVLAERSHDDWQARGGGQHAPAHEVSVRPCELAGGIRFLSSGDSIRPGAALTATFRNLDSSAVYLLLFAVDATRAVHWIAPRFTREGEDPVAVKLPATIQESALDTTVVFDDLAPGPLRIFAVTLRSPAHVSVVEAMEGTAIDRAALLARLPAIDVGVTALDVVTAQSGDR